MILFCRFALTVCKSEKVVNPWLNSHARALYSPAVIQFDGSGRTKRGKNRGTEPKTQGQSTQSDRRASLNFCMEKFKIQHIKQDNYVVYRLCFGEVELLFLFFMQSKDMQSQNHLKLFLFNSLICQNYQCYALTNMTKIATLGRCYE